jgi:hypothetical protein
MLACASAALLALTSCSSAPPTPPIRAGALWCDEYRDFTIPAKIGAQMSEAAINAHAANTISFHERCLLAKDRTGGPR